MDDLGFNKIAAAVLATALGYMLLKEVPHMLMHTESPEAPAYALEIPEISPDGAVPVDVPFPSPDFIAAMDEARGEKVFKKCVSCHNAEAGGKNGTGPNLYGVVDSTAAAKSGFGYSSAMKSANLTWDYETLDGYLAKPGKYVPGTAMNFVGLKKEADRAAVIEYLRVRDDNPPAPPVAAVAEDVPEDVPAEEIAEVVPAEEIVIQEPVEDDIPQAPETVDDSPNAPE